MLFKKPTKKQWEQGPNSQGEFHCRRAAVTESRPKRSAFQKEETTVQRHK